MKRRIVLVIFYTLLLFFSVILYSFFNFNSKQFKVTAVTVIKKEEKALTNLSEAIKIKTVSYAKQDTSSEGEFKKFKEFIAKTYPLVHKKLVKKEINNSFLYKWEGKNTSLKPIILLAHFDVVPVEESAMKKWKENPFSGVIKDGFIWGRGSLDDKVSVISTLEAIETLIGENFTPERSIYLAFGHDEEIGGESGAKQIAQYLEEQNIKAEFILDEGLSIVSGVIPGIDKPSALIGVAEKGYASFELSVDIAGGHSSMPSKENAITILSKALLKINEQQMKPKLVEPVKEFFKYIGPEMGFVNRVIFSNLWLFEPVVIKIFGKTPAGNATTRTTTAITIFKSGIKDNVIPTEAKAIVNFRILPEQTSKEVDEHLLRTIDDERVKVTLTDWINEPPPVSRIDSLGYNVIDKTVRQIFEDTIVAPSMVLAGTDSKHYVKISKDIYRFLPIRLQSEDLSRIHGIDERIAVDNYYECINFYYFLLKNLNK